MSIPVRLCPRAFVHTLVLVAVGLLAGCGDDEPPAVEPPAPTSPREERPQRSPAPEVASHRAGHEPALEPLPEPGSGLADKGVFSDLDERASLRLPEWVPVRSPRLVVDAERRVATLLLGGNPVKAYALTEKVSDPTRLAALPLRRGDRRELAAVAGLTVAQRSAKDPLPDRDGDGIADPVDAMLGARKAALNGAAYQEGYEALAYPGGDVSRDKGVCTDVIVRALRNAGLDLQVELWKDMTARGSRYGLGKRKPDRNIEHRRVRRLLPWFRAYFRSLPAAFDAGAAGTDAWLPGDIVFMDTIASRPGPDHVGLVSDRATPTGHPAIINNWTYGFSTSDMPLLPFVTVTHRFRLGLRR
jgi:uncharacterized protein YijF (DUF1287 family)